MTIFQAIIENIKELRFLLYIIFGFGVFFGVTYALLLLYLNFMDFGVAGFLACFTSLFMIIFIQTTYEKWLRANSKNNYYL